MRRKKLWIGAGVVVVVLGVAVAGASAYLNRQRPTFNLTEGDLALAGYDPVGYFPEGGGTPQPGDPKWTAMQNGRRYQFVSVANRDRFTAAPGHYEPQFGGWCAYAVAHGYKFEVDPHQYLVEDDRLLLFYGGILGDARSEFIKEGAADGVSAADRNWESLKAE